MENWQAFVPAAGGSGEPPQASAAPPLADPGAVRPAGSVPPPRTGPSERARTLSLIDFLADYDARRNPPVYDIRKYGLFLLREADVPPCPESG